VFGTTKRNVALLAGAAGFNLLLGVAVASGVVPQPNAVSVASETPLASADSLVPDAAPATAEAVADVVAEVPPETTSPTEAPPTTAPEARASAAARIAAPSEPAPAPPATTAPAPVVEAPVSVTVPRLNPTSFQVFQAIQQISTLVPMFKPTEAQARQFGDTICTAFDQGKPYAEVKAGVLSAVTHVPGLSVSSSDADAAIRTAVELFCPGHKSKLA
jgi:hypothetical protein